MAHKFDPSDYANVPFDLHLQCRSDDHFDTLQKRYGNSKPPETAFTSFDNLKEFVNDNLNISHPNIGMVCRMIVADPSAKDVRRVYFERLEELTPRFKGEVAYYFSGWVEFNVKGVIQLVHTVFDIRNYHLTNKGITGNSYFTW